MSTPSFSSFFIHMFLSLLLFLSINSGGIKGIVNAKMMSWCVAKPSSTQEQLQADLDYACSQPHVNCSNLGPCSYPDSRAHRASFAMNLYFQTHARQPQACAFKHTALIASSDPSYSENCTYIGGQAQMPAAKKTWCVAKPATDESVLRDIINKICSRIDCGIIKPHGRCYIADNIWNQASVAMNLFYVKSHNCDIQNAGLLVVVDPSFGSCKMPGKQ